MIARDEANAAHMSKPGVNTSRSFGRFLYPFLFDSDTFARRVAAARSAVWPLRNGQTLVWGPDAFDAASMLDHVARYLNPPLEDRATAIRLKLQNGAFQSAQAFANAEWHLINAARRNSPQEISFRFDEIELAMFSTGVGFVTVCARPSSTDPNDWSDFISAFRFAGVTERDIFLRAERKQAVGVPFFPAFAGGTEALDADGRARIIRLVHGLMGTASVAGDPDDWWSEVFIPGQLIPWAGLLVSGLADDDLRLLVHRTSHFFASRQQLTPTARDMQFDVHPGVMPYVENAWFTFSLDGGAFVAGDLPDTPFFRDQLPEHLHTHYYPLLLIALHQRFALIKLSREIADFWLAAPNQTEELEQEVAIDRIRSAFLLFTARGYFAQVMQSEHHHRCYVRWQETFQIARLYEEVRDEIQEMSQHVLQRRTRRIAEYQETAAEGDRRREWGLAAVAGLVGGPSITFGYLGAVAPVSHWAAVAGTVLGIVIGLLLFLLVLNIGIVRRWMTSLIRKAGSRQL